MHLMIMSNIAADRIIGDSPLECQLNTWQEQSEMR